MLNFKEYIVEKADAKDTVTFDIPLLIRVLELTREKIKSDIDLHQMVEELCDLTKISDKVQELSIFLKSLKNFSVPKKTLSRSESKEV